MRRSLHSKRVHIVFAAAIALCVAAGSVGCSEQSAPPQAPAPKSSPQPSTPEPAAKAPEPPATPEAADPATLIARGRSVYAANCTACHNPDPSIDGGLGPAVAGSSLELLRLRVLEAKYPEGYTPKRETGLMIALPHLKDDIEALHAFLNAS